MQPAYGPSSDRDRGACRNPTRHSRAGGKPDERGVRDAPFRHSCGGKELAALIIGMHRDNIVRLLRGTERRIGQREEQG